MLILSAVRGFHSIVLRIMQIYWRMRYASRELCSYLYNYVK